MDDMDEKTPGMESGAEKFPTLEKVLKGFDKILQRAEIETRVLNKVEDEQGLFIFDFEAKLANGTTAECCFKRARVLDTKDGPMNVPSRIHSTIYDTDGMPSGTGPQYDLVDGEWVEIK